MNLEDHPHNQQVESFDDEEAAIERLKQVIVLAIKSRVCDEVELAQTPKRIPFCGPPSGMELPLVVAGLRLEEVAKMRGTAYHVPYYRSGSDLFALGLESGIFPQSIGIDGPFGDKNMTRHPQTDMINSETGTPMAEFVRSKVQILNVSTVLSEHLPVVAGLVAGARIPDQLRASRPDVAPQINAKGNYVTHVVLGDSTVPKADALEAMLDIRTQHAKHGKAPIVVTVLDNGRGISTGTDYQVPGGSAGIDPLYLGMGYQVYFADGSSYGAVEEAYKNAFNDALAGIPALVHVKVTQPHGHASSGDPFLQQPRTAMRNHLENDPVRKIIDLGIEKGVITAGEVADLIEKTRIKTQAVFDCAWEKFVNPVQALAQMASGLLEAAKPDFPESKELLGGLIKELAKSKGEYNVINNHAGWVLDILRQFLVATRRGKRSSDGQSRSRSAIIDLYCDIKEDQQKRFDAHVWAPFQVSPLNVPFIPATNDGATTDAMNSVLAAYFCTKARRTPNLLILGQDAGYPMGGPVREFLGLSGRKQVEIQGARGPWSLIRNFLMSKYKNDKDVCLQALFTEKRAEIETFLREAYPDDQKRVAFLDDCFGSGKDILAIQKGEFFNFDKARADNYDRLMFLIFGETPDVELPQKAITVMEKLFFDAENGYAKFARDELEKFWKSRPMLDAAVLEETGPGAPTCDNEGIKEATILGKGLGLAMAGNKVVATIQFLDFLEAGMAMLTTRIAPLRYLSSGRQDVTGGNDGSLLIVVNGDPRLGPWHSNNRIAEIISSTPGLRVIFPRNGVRAAMLYEAALRSADPTLAIQSLPGLPRKELAPTNLGKACMPFGRSELIFSALIDSTDADSNIGAEDRERVLDAKRKFSVAIVTYGGNGCAFAKKAGEQFLAEADQKQAVALQVIDLQCLDSDSRDRNGKALMTILHSRHVLFADDDMAGGAASIICEDLLQKRTDFDAFLALSNILKDKTKLSYMRKHKLELDMVMMFLQIVKCHEIYLSVVERLDQKEKGLLFDLLKNCEDVEYLHQKIKDDIYVQALIELIANIVSTGKARKIGKCVLAADTLACPQHLTPYGFEAQNAHHLTPEKIRDAVDQMLSATYNEQYVGGIFS